MKADRAQLRAVPRRQLDRAVAQEMAANWLTLVCRHGCGTAHLGVCTRVKRIRTTRLPNGTINEDVEYFPNGKWSPPEHGWTAEEVGATPTVAAPIEATASETQPTKKKGHKP